jgi:diguanylate cyclase (GGDEF)-like protein
MIFSAIADISFALFESQGAPYVLAYMNVPWMCAIVAQMLATVRIIASGPEMLNDPPSRFGPAAQLFRLALPYLAIAVGLILLAILINSTLRPDVRLILVLYGAFGLVALVLWRQYIVSKENVRLYQKMQRIAWTDSLTSVYNRHFFNEMLPREMERASRYGNQLSVLLLDIDGFKKYNDTFGHLKGDIVLKTIARIFSLQLRKSDTIARFGGDEFVVILPETNRHRAIAIANRIQSAVAAQSFNNVALSVSIGVASFRPGLTPEQLLDEADQDMYRRKNSSRQKKQPAIKDTSAEMTISAFRDDT